MEGDHGQVSGGAAQIYQEFFVPALFQEWAPRAAERAQLRPGQRVLDVACGTGVLAREAAGRAGADSVCGLGRNEGMLAVARAEAPAIEWRSGRAEDLSFEADTYDAVLSQFGLMFFDDRARALGEMWLVLRPGGRLVVAAWGPLADTPGYAAMVDLLERLLGERIANELRAPYCLGEPGALRSLFAEVGIADVRIETLAGTARFPSITDWIRTDVKGWTLADKIDDAEYALLLAVAKVHMQPFARGGGRVEFAAPAHIVFASR